MRLLNTNLTSKKELIASHNHNTLVFHLEAFELIKISIYSIIFLQVAHLLHEPCPQAWPCNRLHVRKP